MRIELHLDERERATLMDALYTAETKYRYQSSNLLELGPKGADQIRALIEKITRAIPQESR